MKSDDLRGRRKGDVVNIPGDYQHRVLTSGPAPQRFWHYAKYLEATRWLNPQEGDYILDIGCGSGVAAARLAQKKETQVFGIDANQEAVGYARRNFQMPNLGFAVGLVDELAFKDESIDKIALLEVIEHLYPDQAARALSEHYRLLKPGGRLVITTPNSRSLWPIIQWGLDVLRLVPSLRNDQHISNFNASKLTALAESVGFRVVTCRTVHLIAPWLASFNWRLALSTHDVEQRMPHTFGNLLLACVEK